MKKILFAFSGFLLFLAPSGFASAKITENEISAVVQIFEYSSLSEMYETSGSGTIVSSDGRMIITNHHVVSSVINDPETYTWYSCITYDPRQDPFCNFTGTILAYDEQYDIALLRVDQAYTDDFTEMMSFDDWKREEGITEFPFVKVDVNATEDGTALGDEVTILGYPAVGGSSITLTRGVVSGFQSMNLGGENVTMYIKTDAKVNPGNSGGAAFDSNNNYIGIPTLVAGGGGNIGYLVALPIITTFLRENGISLEEGTVDNNCGNHSHSLEGGDCECNMGYEWESDDPANLNCTPIPTVECGNHSHLIDSDTCECDEGYLWASEEEDNLDCILQDIEVDTASGTQTYTNEEEMFSVEFPIEWGIEENYMGTVVSANSPAESESDSFYENCNVVTESELGDYSLEGYYDINIENMVEYVDAFTILEESDLTMSGVPAILVEFTATFDTVEVHDLQYFLMNGTKAYILTCTGNDSSIESYRNEFENVAQSFFLLDGPEIGDGNEGEQIFPDVGISHRNLEAISYLFNEGIVSGYPDGTFRPAQSVNRAELLKLLIGASVMDFDPALYDQSCFSDVAAGQWFTPYVCYAKEMGWVRGYSDGSFRPAQTVTKVESIKMVLEAFAIETPDVATVSYFDDVNLEDWFAPYIETAYDYTFLEESSSPFSPHSDMTRAGVSEVIYRVYVFVSGPSI